MISSEARTEVPEYNIQRTPRHYFRCRRFALKSNHFMVQFYFAGLRVDDTQVDLMGGSDEASNERPSFVVPTGRTLRSQKGKRTCRSCEEDVTKHRKAEKAAVFKIVRQRVGRKNRITFLLSPSKRGRGRRKGRLARFVGCKKKKKKKRKRNGAQVCCIRSCSVMALCVMRHELHE